jgi:hypothetical protein
MRAAHVRVSSSCFLSCAVVPTITNDNFHPPSYPLHTATVALLVLHALVTSLVRSTVFCISDVILAVVTTFWAMYMCACVCCVRVCVRSVHSSTRAIRQL